MGDLLFFFRVDLLIFRDCTASALITGSLNAIRDRGSTFSLENHYAKEWVKQLGSALELPCARAVGAVLPSTALERRSGCDRNNLRQDRRSCSDSCVSDSQ